MDINEFSFLSAGDDLKIILSLMDKIETIPASVHRVFTPKNSIQLGKSLGETSFVCALAAHCLTTIPKFCTAYIDMENFNEIKPEDKMQGMNRIHLQLMIFKSILIEILESPALVDYTASVAIINRMDTALQNLLQCLEQVQNGEQVNPFAAL